MNKQELAQLIDHTLLKASAEEKDIINLCQEAIINNFYSVCVNPYHVNLCHNQLSNTSISICSVVGFPLGQNSSVIKILEAEKAINDGADEIDMVINLTLLKKKEYLSLENEIQTIRDEIGTGKVLKLIIETCYLQDDEISIASEIGLNCGVDYIKTSTGFGSRGASVHDIQIIKNTVGDQVKIKASGGIKKLKSFMQYVDLGVNRIGTSNGITILSELDL